MKLIKDIYLQKPLKMKTYLLIIYDKINKAKEIISEIKKLYNHKDFRYEKNNENKKILNIGIY